jgi:hypothetical protein
MDEDSNIFIVVWDMTGLEVVIDARELQSEDVMRKLRDEKGSKLGQTLFYLTQRARANTHRCYEIYSIHTNPDIDKMTMVDMFHENPQASADLIRARGTKIYSDRLDKKVQVIT